MESEIKEELKKWIVAFTNNIVLFSLTFFIAFLTFNIAIILTSKMLGIEVNLSNYTVQAGAIGANVSHVFMIFLSGPIALICLGIFFYTFFTRFKKKKGIWKILFLWGYLNAFNMLLGNFVIGLLTDSGFGEIAWRLHFSDFSKIFSIFLSLILIVVIGNANAKYFYTTTFSRSFIESRKKRLTFLLLCIIVPFLIGISIFSLINFSSENSFYQRTAFLSMGLMLLPALRNNITFSNVRIIKEHIAPTIVWGWAIILVILAILYRTILGLGFSI